jgi:hypothetical protein
LLFLKISNLHFKLVVGIRVRQRVELLSLKHKVINAFLDCAEQFVNVADLCEYEI